MDLEKFHAIEKKYGLLEANVSGYCFWIYARPEIQYYISGRINSYTSSHPQAVVGFWKKTMLRVHMMLNALLRGRITCGRQNMLVLNQARRVWVDDHYECIYTDDIVREMGNALVLETPYDQKHFKPVKTPNLVYLDGIEIKAQLHYYFNKYFRKKLYRHAENEIYKQIKNPLEDLAGIYNIQIDYKDILNLIMPEFFKYQIKKKEYTKIVKKVRPKIVLEVVSYAPDCMIVNEVAKEHHIPIVELQHGVAGQGHFAYNYPEDVSIRQFPDYFFTFSKFWTSQVGFPISKDHVIATGYPYLEKQRAKYQVDAKKKSTKTELLFLSQGIIGKYLAEIAIDLTKRLDMNKYQIIFKLHPAEYASWKMLFPKLVGCRGIEVIDNSRRNLYELFAEADIQIGFTSTAIYEGLIYNLDTYIYVKDTNPQMEDLLKLGYAQKFASGSELAELIEKRGKKSANNANELWEPDALNNIIKQLNLLIDREDKS